MIQKKIPFMIAIGTFTAPLWAGGSPMHERSLPFSATTTDTVVLRATPSDKGAKVKCDLYGRSEAGIIRKNSTTLSKGFTLQVLERSAKKVKVGKWNNYWYKISARDPNDGGPATCEVGNEAAQAWVFGEFLNAD